MTQLRPYQQQLVDDNLAAWAAGHRNVLCQLATGGGKTVVIGEHVKREPGLSVLIAHRQELVGQLALQMAREGVYHDVLAPASVRRDIVSAQMELYGRSYLASGAHVQVAGVDTLARRGAPSWAAAARLVVVDEAHHVTAANKWGQAVGLFPNARGLFPTATPVRADGLGLGRHADGLADVMTHGPTQRWLIDEGYLSQYRLVCPPESIHTEIAVSPSTGDFSQPAVRKAAHESSIVGDGIAHYLRWTPGKLCIAYTVDVESAVDAASRFRAEGVAAEVISAKTPTSLRAHLMRQFREGKLRVLVNCDTLSEGVDVPGVEVVLDMSPTRSFARYCLDPETEVLTPEGWKRADEALRATEVVGFDPKTGEARTCAVKGRIRRPLLPGESMYSVQSPHLDAMVSDKHRMLVKSWGKSSVNWQFRTAEETARRKAMYLVPVAGRSRLPDCGLTDSELHFLGWFLSDGCRNKSNNAVLIGQSVAKPAHISHIRAAIEGCGFKHGEYVHKRKGAPETHNDLLVFSVSKGAPIGRDRHLAGWARLEPWIDKSVPPVYDTLSERDLRVLLEAWNLGDGFNDHSCIEGYELHTLRIHCGDNRVMADRLQHLCVTRGLRCNIAARPARPGGKVLYVAYIKETTESSLPGLNIRDGEIEGKKPYSRSRLERTDARPAFVWCLETELGTLITRRNGKVLIMGNCQRFGRMLRAAPGKTHGWYLDPAGNVMRNNGPPDWRVHWTLDAAERRPSQPADWKRCANAACLQVYPRELRVCPHCNEAPPASERRGGPAVVDGDLTEIDPDWLRERAREIARIAAPEPRLPHGLAGPARIAAHKHHTARREAHEALRHACDVWAACQDVPLDQAYRRFYLRFGTDVATALTLGRADAEGLRARVEASIVADGFAI